MTDSTNEEDIYKGITKFCDMISIPLLVIQEGKIVFANKAFCEESDYDKEDLIGKTYYKLVYNGDLEIVKQREKLLKTGKKPLNNLILRVVSRTGQIRFANVIATDIQWKSKTARLLLVFRLSNTHQLFQTPIFVLSFLEFLQSSDEIGLWIDDFSGRTVLVNDYLCKKLGYTHEELHMKQVEDFLDAVSKIIYRKKMDERRTKKKLASTYELTIVSRTGKKLPFRVIGGTLFDYERRALGTIGVFISIEELQKRNKLQAAINSYILASYENEEFWSNVMDDLMDIFTAQHSMIYFEHKIQAQKGEWVLSEDPEEVLETLIRSSRVSIKLKEDEDSIFHSIAKSTVICTLYREQQPMGFIYLASAIPDNFSKDDVNLLEHFSNQIVSIYTSHFLRNTTERERLFFSVLLDILSHDFVNSNTSLHGYIELIEQMAEENNIEKIKDYVKRAKPVLKKSDIILSTVQQLTRLHSEPIRFRKMQLKQILEQAISIQKSYLRPDQKLEINLDCPEDLIIEGGIFTQDIFENIISASIASSALNVKLDIICKEIKEKGKNMVECLIYDYTRIITKEQLELINKHLSRGDRRFGEEFGIKLYLAKTITECYAGELRIEPSLEKNATKLLLHFKEG